MATDHRTSPAPTNPRPIANPAHVTNPNNPRSVNPNDPNPNNPQSVTTLPGDGVPKFPGTPPPMPPPGAPTGTPPPTGGPPTGVKPPGWFPVFWEILKAYVANAHLSSQGTLPDGIIDLASELTDRLIARYPLEFRIDPVATRPAPPATVRPFSR